MDILNKLQEIVCDILGNESIVLTESTVPQDLEDWDSLMLVNIIASAESVFDVKFDLNELTKFKTFGELSVLIEKKVNR